jgi:hypothetical protein
MAVEEILKSQDLLIYILPMPRKQEVFISHESGADVVG